MVEAGLYGLDDHIKLFRENILLGSYDQGQAYAQEVISRINQFWKTQTKPDVRRRWQRTEESLKNELKVVTSILKELEAFKEPPGKKRIKSNTPIVEQNLPLRSSISNTRDLGNLSGKSEPKNSARSTPVTPSRSTPATRAPCSTPARSYDKPWLPRPPPSEPEKEDNKTQIDSESQRLRDSLSSIIVSEKPTTKWDDVAGLNQAKTLLKEAVILPIKFPQLFTGSRKPWQGILLYGPPGTGKSFLAKALANEANNSTFFSVSSSDLVSKYLGESERLIKNMFEMARLDQPAIIFIDEVDSMCCQRSDQENEAGRRIKTEFLVQMQGGVDKDNKGLLVLGATNTPWNLDPAIRRRFEKRIFIDLPDESARETLFKIHIYDYNHNINDNDFKTLAKRTNGFSGSDVFVLLRDALMEPIRRLPLAKKFKKIQNGENDFLYEPCSENDPDGENMTLMDIPADKLKNPGVEMSDFERVLQYAKPTVGLADLKKYEEWTEQYGQEGL